jgi:hypothetical protein
LRVAERYKRSKELLQAEIMRFDQCQPGSTAADSARKALSMRPRRGELEDAADANLKFAEDLSGQESKLCSPAPGGNAGDAVSRILARLSKR